jgi:outer membrane protein OmpA-like peptidoglycan-associated protein/tetratricopeptide (TPR) repeat protein
MKRFVIIIFLCLPILSLAQKQRGRDSAIIVAKREFSNLRFAYAIPFYKRHLFHHSDDTDALKDLGYCYKINNQYDSALLYYEKASLLGEVKDNVLAELYANMGMYEKAVKAYDALLAGNNIDSSSSIYKLYKTRQLGFYNHVVYSKDSIDYNLYYLKVNTPMNEFSPTLLDSGFVFESNRGHRVRRNEEFGWDAKPFSQLFFQSYKQNLRIENSKGYAWTEKKIRRSITDYTLISVNDNNIFSPNFDLKRYEYNDIVKVPFLSEQFKISKGNFGSISFTKDGKEAYFTKNQKINRGISELEIWTAKRKNNKDWSKFTKLSINEKGTSIFHPAISDDGTKLYFATDREGGFGGTDIYVTEKQTDGKWGKPVNAGEMINTAGNELFPTYYGGYLYFSSNGHGGLGGLDVFKYLPEQNIVENVGAPVNSNKDDLGYSRSGIGGYFSSNRYGSDDIFEFEYDPKERVKLYGKTVINKLPRKDAQVKLYHLDSDRMIDSALTDSAGKYMLMGRKNNQYKITIDDREGHRLTKNISTENEDKDLGEFDLSNEDDGKDISQFNLSKEEVGIVDAVNKKLATKRQEVYEEVAGNDYEKFVVYYELDKYELTKNDEIVLNELVKRLNSQKELNAIIGSFTDCSADFDYNIKLSNKRSAAVTRYLIDMGIAAGRIVESYYGKRYLVKQCEDNQYDVTEQLANRRSEVFLTTNKKDTWESLNKKEIYPVTLYSKDIERSESLYNTSKGRRAYNIQNEQAVTADTKNYDRLNSAASDKAQEVNTTDTLIFAVFFNLDQYDLQNSFGTLSGIKDLMNVFKEYQCVISGHTDNEGNALYDQKLSERRAISVKNYFISYNVNPSRLKVVGYGSTRPSSDYNYDMEEGWKNRRVEIRLFR